MKTLTSSLRPVCAAATFAVALALPARASVAGTTTWDSAGFRAVVSGTSTLHDWSVETTVATGEYRAASGTGKLTIPAASLSGGPKGLDERMHAALKSDAFPMIVFEALEVAAPAGALEAGRVV